ncbi:transposase [Paenibacillus sp. KS-LC4]|uniref:transposase n=1 Tax=Paenibacillus sp. KS-LC4 TaxID=2979727 RepID=UPI0030CAA810
MILHCHLQESISHWISVNIKRGAVPKVINDQVREKLRSDEGYALSVRRMIKPESVFGQMKNNWGFRRFLLRGLPKVSLEFGRLSLAHNLLTKATIDQKSEIAVQG